MSEFLWFIIGCDFTVCLNIEFILFFYGSVNDTEWNAAFEAMATDEQMMRKTLFDFRS